MKRVRGALAELPPAARWGVLAGGAILLLLLAGGGTWALLERREAAAQQAFVRATSAYGQAVVSGQDGALAAAVADLKAFLSDHPRSRVSGEAWYYLGNLEYQRRAYDAAARAFTEASRLGSPTTAGLSRLGLGYAWEAKGEPSRAVETYRQALVGRGPTDFLYGELLLALARAQEELKQPQAAIETYKRFLRDMPSSGRAEEVRIRLALLGASA